MAYRYLTRKINGKTKLLHRHTMEQHLGRPLLPTEHVHHLNGDTKDNRLENLQVINGRDHLQEHAEEKRRHPNSKLCVICSAEFTPHPTKRKRQQTCSTECANTLRSRTEKATKAAIARAQFETHRQEAVA